MRNWDGKRRDLLKSLGVGLACLPILRAGKTFAAGGPKRLMIITITNGYRQLWWKPMTGDLMTQTLPDSTSPLEPHKKDLLFLPDMSFPSFPGPNGHGAYVTHLTGGPNTEKGEYRQALSASIDQVVGPVLAKAAGLSRATLNLGILIDQARSGEDANSKRCIFRGKDQPITPQQNPFKVYTEIFAGGVSNGNNEANAKKLLARKKSILDYVGADLERFKNRLGTEDKDSIDGHILAIRDLEKQLAAPANPIKCTNVSPAVIDHLDRKNYEKLVKINLDLMLAAIACDVTRTVTIQMAEASGQNINWSYIIPTIKEFPGGFAGGGRNWHDIAHSPVRADGDDKRLIDKWWMTRFAEFLVKAKAIIEPGGNLLDSSVVLFTNPMQEGSTHNSQKMPWILAGSAKGFFKTGQCANSLGKSVSGALGEVCNSLDVPVDYFGNAEYGKIWSGLRA